jgi:hypothetical protein
VAVDELSVVLKARELINKVSPTKIPVPIQAYIEHEGAVLRVEYDLPDDEPGYCVPSNGKNYICVNGNDGEERWRFTACHELAHISLGLPSDHSASPWWSYMMRPTNEILCDVFAAELLLPYKLFKPLIEKNDICLAGIDDLAERFLASTTATGSRFATLVKAPCAFVLSEQGKVRYASRSTALREARAWIPPRMALPDGSVSARVCAGINCNGAEETEAEVWFTDWSRGGVLLEEARYLKKWDQTLTLLWFEDEEVPAEKQESGQRETEEFGLAELDGNLPWPGKKRRK